MNFYFCIFFTFINLLLNSFSLKINSINPTTATQGKHETFLISITKADSENINDSFYIGDEYHRPIKLTCDPYNQQDESITCNSVINFQYSFYLSYFSKKLYYDGKETGFFISIVLPNNLQLIDADEEIYKGETYKIRLYVNLNTLYSSNYIFRIGDNYLNNCSISTENINDIYCIYSYLSGSGKENVYLNDIKTNIECNIITPTFLILSVFKYNYFINSNFINLYFKGDSVNNLNSNSIYLNSSNNEIFYGTCSSIDNNYIYSMCKFNLTKSDVYNIYINNNNNNNDKNIVIYPELKTTNKIYDINPKESLISYYDVIFTIEIDYFDENNSIAITLVNINNKIKIYLKKCGLEKKKDNINIITCGASILETGTYEIFLNGISQNLFVNVFSTLLLNAYYIKPNLIRLKSNLRSIEIYFDSIVNLTSTKIELKSSKNENLNAYLNYDFFGENYVNFEAKFYAADTYFLYINGKKQMANITVFDKNFFSKVIDINPKNVIVKKNITFFLTVDTNFGISDINLKFIRDNNANTIDLNCEANSSDITKAICVCFFNNIGNYILNYENSKNFSFQIDVVDQQNLIGFLPVHFLPFSEQSIYLYFDTDIYYSRNKISLRDVNNNIIILSCNIFNSNHALICSFTSEFEGIFYIHVGNVNYGDFVNINENDNKNLDDEEENNFYLKMSFFLCLYLFIII